MSPVSPGAVELPMHHVSVRVPWHDTDWTGRVCTAPSANHSCTVLKNVKENKRPESEDVDAGRTWDEADELPPCVAERAGFMRTKPFVLPRTHNYAWKQDGAHHHFAETLQRMPPYSLEVTPFRWVMRHQYDRYTDPWGIQVDAGIEQEVQEKIAYEKDVWVQDHRNQLALLDSFFSALRPRQSLVLLYVKDLPLVEDRVPGARYLVGAGFVDRVDPVVEWDYSSLSPGDLRSIMWERGVSHSIRPSFSDGFLLPYQELLSNPAYQDVDLAPLVARTPNEHFDEFSYVSELVSQDGAIAALTELGRVLELLPDVLDGPWEQCRAWLGERLAEAWHARGPYPGLGSMLVAAGLDRGPVLARRALDGLDAGVDPWPVLADAIESNLDGLVGRPSRRAWQKLVGEHEQYRQFRLMSRFALSVAQARDLFGRLDPAAVLDNPYVLYEASRDTEPVALTTVDRGLFPQDAASRTAIALDPFPDPVDEAGDDRRVRAASIEVLERAAGEGHTILDEPGLRKRLGRLELDPTCDPVDALFELAAEDFAPLLLEQPLAGDENARGWQLDRLAQARSIIRAETERRLEAPILDVMWPWASRIDAVLGEDVEPDEHEQAARHEKTAALETIVRSRISALVGPAGTGKTSMLEALCADPEIDAGGVLLLAPTGKAAVQLQARTRKPARTLAQFLLKHGRYDTDRQSYVVAPDQSRHSASRTVVIDEASMLTEEMLAATIDALSGVARLILCGDPRQLPPIGAGRPFADLVAYLRAVDGPGGGVAELRTGRRQRADIDAVKVASLFSIDAVRPGADEALARVIAGGGDETIEIVGWSDEDDLHKKLVDTLCAAGLGLETKTRGALFRSFGADCEDTGIGGFPKGEAGAGAERWQLLSAVRARPGGVAGLNALVRRVWRPGDVSWTMRRNKFLRAAGADQIIFSDKVMCLRNRTREAYLPQRRENEPGSVANGEIGLVTGTAVGKRPWGLNVEFSSQPGRSYTFKEWELNDSGEAATEWFELAYAVTIHKSQGSQFEVTLVIVPDPCPLLTPELLYTALTRQQERVIVFKQGEPSALRDYASPSRSETARRLTCLFRPANPFELPDETVVDAAHVHKTARGELVRSKSEVIVADALHDLGVDYGYEVELRMSDGTQRLPDFTIGRDGGPPVYWEHLGMLDRPGYRADWIAKKQWYANHGILPWDEGGGPGGVLVCSDERIDGPGISSQEIRELAAQVLSPQPRAEG